MNIQWIILLILQMVYVTCLTDKPNVLFIVLDDFRPELGSYGNKVIKTPHMDYLASKSVLFQNAYAQQALCGPSRTSFLTGRRPDTTRLWDVHSYWRQAAGNYTTLPQHFMNNGYLTQSFGKIFHPGIVSGKTYDYPYSWSVPPYIPSTRKYKMKKVCPGPNGELQMNIVCPVNVSTQPEKMLPDIQSTECAIQFIHNMSINQKGPFFLALGYYKPHIPFKFPEKYLDLYPLKDISLAKHHNKPSGLPSVAWNPWTDLRMRDDVKSLNISFPYGPVPLEYQKKMIQSYYASTTYVDDLIGKVLSSINSCGLMNNTIIVLTGDHGWALGENQEWSKYSNFEVATRVPLLVSVPGMTYNTATPNYNLYASGIREREYMTTDALVELVDLFSTLSDLAGIEVPPMCPIYSFNVTFCAEGVSFVPLLKAFSKPDKRTYNTALSQWKTAVFSQYPRPSLVPQENSDQPKSTDAKIMGYTMRTHQYRYTEWIQFFPHNFSVNWNTVYSKELYIEYSDRDEYNNVADFSQYSGLVRQMSRQLRLGWRKALPSVLNTFK